MTLQKLEQTLWKASDSLRGSLDSSEYKDIVLPIFFLKHINNIFENHRSKLDDNFKDFKPAYYQDMILFVPPKAKWSNLLNIKNPEQVKDKLDQAFLSLMEENPDFLKNVFPSNFFQNEKYNSNNLIRLIENFEKEFHDFSKFNGDFAGKAYEYFLKQFALSSGKKSGEFYTPSCVVELLVSLIKPREGTLYDPCFGSGGMFIKTFDYLKHNVYQNLDDQKKKEALSKLEIYGQEKNRNSWRLGKLNLVLHNISNQKISKKFACTFLSDQFKEETFDYILANPPFNLKEYWDDLLKNDFRWNQFGQPTKANANYAWIQHIASKLNKTGIAAFVMANNSLTENSTKSNRQKLIDANLVETIISLPYRLFYSTTISACIWILNKNKVNQDILFINCENFGIVKNSICELTKEQIDQITNVYQNFLNHHKVDTVNFCKVVSKKEIKSQHYSLLPNQYIDFIEPKFLNFQTKEKTQAKINDIILQLKKINDQKKQEKQFLDKISFKK